MVLHNDRCFTNYEEMESTSVPCDDYARNCIGNLTDGYTVVQGFIPGATIAHNEAELQGRNATNSTRVT